MSKSNRTHPSALIMLSGGLDSAVALFWAKNKKYAINTITFDYFRRSRRERSAASHLSKLTKSTQHTINVDFLKEIEDSKRRTTNLGLENAPSAYIPSRNVIFYGIASSFAELDGANYIVGGHNKDDVNSFPDASKEFFDQFNRTTAKGLYTGAKSGRVILPFSKMSKTEVVILGDRLGVPFQLTWSCYKFGSTPCGGCHACELRNRAFRDAGLSDPLLRRR